MAVYKRGEVLMKILLALTGLNLLAHTNARIEVQEDRDLTGCSVELNSYIFSLAGLKRSTPKFTSAYKVQYNNGKGNITIDFNICDYSFRKCPDEASDFANIINENNTCSHMSSGSLSDVGVSLIDNDKPDLGLRLNFTGGNMCNDTAKFQLLLQLNCDDYAQGTSYSLDTSSLSSPCTPRVIMTSKEACPKLSLGSLWHFFNENYYIFGLGMMCLGVFLMISGGRFFKFTLFLTGQATVAGFILILMFGSVYPTNSPQWVVWLTLIVSLGMGAGIGYACMRWVRIGVLLIGTWIGGLLGAILYSLVFYLFAKNNPILALWLTIAFCAVIIAILSMIFFDHAVIIGSSLGGAYVFVRFAGGYPNEFLIYENYNNGTIGQVNPVFFIYILFVITLSVISVVFQINQRSRNLEMYNYRKYDFKYRRA
ncbi:UNKNOWN [Stylonychia lemnae]|uniref:Transmembrane protein 198 n=1 Tax=Stylonychia lemnae TaxID=5949 RepID=A0A077ZPB8_STYLE|nr:UNKNOWN [Stylonychia lemnae]|eukprot:CDW71763.1 UNKNOWN [Stylonychia lemnae]